MNTEAMWIAYTTFAKASSIGVFAAFQDVVYENKLFPETLLPIIVLCKGVVSGSNKRSAFKSLVAILYSCFKALVWQMAYYLLGVTPNPPKHYVPKRDVSGVTRPSPAVVVCTQALEEEQSKLVAKKIQKQVAGVDRLAVDIWQIILSNLCPSQLTKVAQVSRRLADIVTSLPTWQKISITANLGKPKARGRRITYYGMVLASSHRICERCYEVCKKNIPFQAALPLHVKEQDKSMRLCLDCRREHLAEYPESEDSYIAKRYGGQVGLDAVQQRRKAIIERKESLKELKARRYSARCARLARDSHFQKS